MTKRVYQRETVVLSDIYLKYPHKKYDITSSTIPFPYFPKEEITNTELSYTYKEWNELVQDYLKIIRSEMATGKTFVIPSNLGKVVALKYRRKGFAKSVDWSKSNDGEIVYRKNSDIFSKWATTFRWRKWDNRFKFKNIWKLKLARSIFRT